MSSRSAPKARREVFGIIGGLGAAIFVAGCAGSSAATKGNSSQTSSSTSTTAAPETVD